MHSSASRATDGIGSVKRACEEPNASFMSEDKKDPNNTAANSENRNHNIAQLFSDCSD